MSRPPATDRLSRLPLAEVLERVAARTPAPGGGTSAAMACALAAALVEMSAGFEAGGDERGAAAAHLRARALDLAEEDLESYAPVLEALRRPAEDAERPERLAAALSAAAAVPFGIAQAAAEVAGLARAGTEGAGRHLLGDSATAAVLAGAACRAAALLVELNLDGTGDPRLPEAAQLARTAEVDSQRAVHKARVGPSGNG